MLQEGFNGFLISLRERDRIRFRLFDKLRAKPERLLI